MTIFTFARRGSGGGGGSGALQYVGEASGSATTGVTLSAIPAHESLYIEYFGTDDGVNTFLPSLRYNGDSGSNYKYVNKEAGSQSSSASATSIQLVRQGTSNNSEYSGSANIFDDEAEFGNEHGEVHGTFRIGSIIKYDGGGSWNNSAAITSISLVNGNGLNAASLKLKVWIRKT